MYFCKFHFGDLLPFTFDQESFLLYFSPSYICNHLTLETFFFGVICMFVWFSFITFPEINDKILKLLHSEMLYLCNRLISNKTCVN